MACPSGHFQLDLITMTTKEIEQLVTVSGIESHARAYSFDGDFLCADLFDNYDYCYLYSL